MACIQNGMPEILTKHPEIVMKVLKSEGAKCGTGAKPKILTKCPSDKFCTLAGGELCIYGSGELGKMTQLAPADLCKSSVAPMSSHDVVPAVPPSPEPGQQMFTALPIVAALVGAGVVGLVRRRASTA